MTEHEKLIRRQIEQLELKLEDARYKGQTILVDRINREIGRLCNDNDLERKPPKAIEKKFGEL